MHWIKQLELFHTKNYTYHNSTCLQTPLYRKMTCPNRLSELATNFEPLLTCAPSIDLDPNRTIQFVLINGCPVCIMRGLADQFLIYDNVLQPGREACIGGLIGLRSHPLVMRFADGTSQETH